MRSALLVALLALGVTPALEAKYRRMSDGELFLTADLVVVGEIAAEGSESFTVAVTHVAAAKAPVEKGATILVAKFVPWTCAGHPIAYTPGGRVLLCLEGKAGASAPWKLLGAGGEGARAIQDGRVARFGGQLDADAPSVEDVVAAVGGYRRCFELDRSEPYWPRPVPRCTPAELEAFGKSSRAAAALVLESTAR